MEDLGEKSKSKKPKLDNIDIDVSLSLKGLITSTLTRSCMYHVMFEESRDDPG